MDTTYQSLCCPACRASELELSTYVRERWMAVFSRDGEEVHGVREDLLEQRVVEQLRRPHCGQELEPEELVPEDR